MAKAMASESQDSSGDGIKGLGLFFLYGKKLLYLHFVCTIYHAKKSVGLAGIVVAFAQGKEFRFESGGVVFRF